MGGDQSLSKKDDVIADPPFTHHGANGVNFVTETTCKARHETVEAKVDGLKNAIYLSATTMTIIIVVVQLIVTLVRG